MTVTISNNFVPNRQTILSITNANPGVVTTTQANGYHNGLYVRLVIPTADGMQQANGNIYLITIIDSISFSLNADTSNFDSFSPISTSQVAQVIPVGEISATLKNAVENNGNIIPET